MMMKTKARVLACSATLVTLLGFQSEAYAQSAAIQPCGGSSGSLWAWTWAGTNGSNLTFNSNNFGVEIVTANDLSGNGNHYFNNDEYNQDPPTRPAY